MAHGVVCNLSEILLKKKEDVLVVVWGVMHPLEKHGSRFLFGLRELRSSYPCSWEPTGYPIFIKPLCLQAGAYPKRTQDFDKRAQVDSKDVRL